MPKPFDASLKDLIESYPADWLSFLGLGTAAAVEAIDADVSTVSGAADKVLRIAADPPWLMHIELQAGAKSGLDEWLHWYNTLVGHRQRLPVRTVLVLLRPAADAPGLTGSYREQFPGGALPGVPLPGGPGLAGTGGGGAGGRVGPAAVSAAGRRGRGRAVGRRSAACRSG